MDNVSHTVTIEVDGEKQQYSMTTIPKADSKLVELEKEKVLGQLSLDKLIKNLQQAGGLLELAYNGTAASASDGFSVQGRINTLMGNLYELVNNKCTSAMTFFKAKCDTVLQELRFTFSELLSGNEEDALQFLEYAGEAAGEMSERASALGTEFNEMSQEASEILEKTIDQKNISEADRQKLEDQLAKDKADMEHAQKRIKDLAETRKRMQELYLEAKEKAEKAEDKAFAVAIVGAIFGALADGIGTFAGVYAGAKTGGAGKNGGVVVPPPTPVEADDDEPIPEPVSGSTDEPEDPVSDGDSDGDATDDSDVTTDADTDDSKNEDSSGVNAKLAAAKGSATAMKKAGAAAQSSGDSFAAVAKAYHAEKLKYLELKEEALKEEQKLLADVARYATLLQNSTGSIETTKLAIEGLMQAIAAMKRVHLVLMDAAKFWDNMAEACERLSKDPRFMRKVRSNVGKNATAEKRAEIYANNNLFKEDMVRYMAGWKAIEVICTEYAVVTDKVAQDIKVAYKKNPSTEESLKLAPVLGRKLLSQNEEERQQIEQDIKVFQDARSEGQNEKAA